VEKWHAEKLELKKNLVIEIRIRKNNSTILVS
jgi:hypothetical protein